MLAITLTAEPSVFTIRESLVISVGRYIRGYISRRVRDHAGEKKEGRTSSTRWPRDNVLYDCFRYSLVAQFTKASACPYP